MGFIFVILQFLSSSLDSYLINTHTHNSKHNAKLKILAPNDTHIPNVLANGPAAAVRNNLAQIIKHPADYFVILSGDQLYSMDINEMLQQTIKTNADLMISTLLVDEEDAQRMGVMKINSNLEIIDFHEKPKEENTLSKRGPLC